MGRHRDDDLRLFLARGGDDGEGAERQRATTTSWVSFDSIKAAASLPAKPQPGSGPDLDRLAIGETLGPVDHDPFSITEPGEDLDPVVVALASLDQPQSRDVRLSDHETAVRELVPCRPGIRKVATPGRHGPTNMS